MASRLSLLLLLGFALSVPLQLAAQVPVGENGEPLVALDDEGFADETIQEIPSLTGAELEQLVGPVALYPDDLLAIVLPASTYPLQIVQAARFLDELDTDGSLQPDESWDESVVALLNYPEVVRMMDKDIDWTWRLGEAVISQQADVIAAVESFRDRAYAAGNLQTDEYQTVSNDDGSIAIDPVDEEIIYVPYYEPAEVVVYQPRRRVYFYYPHAYPLYYYPYPYGHTFASGHFWGVTTAFRIGWSNHYLQVHHPSYWGHPYYGHHYYGHHYRQPSISLYNSWYVQNSHHSSTHQHRDGDHWRPQHRSSGARPATRSVRNQHYPSGSSDTNHVDSRSNRRTQLDNQDSSRRSSDRNRSSSSASDGRIRITASNGAGRESDTGTSGRSGIRFRDRSGTDTIRADRNSTYRGRQTSQRAVPARQPAASNTSSRSGASLRQTSQRPASRPTVQRQAPSQRPASRPTVQRQAPSQRPASRPTIQRQAPAPRAAPAAAPQRQSAPRQSAPSQSAPRQLAPRQSAPRQSAPRQSAPSGSHSQPSARPQRRRQ